MQLLALEAQRVGAFLAFIVFKIQQLAAMGTLEKLHLVEIGLASFKLCTAAIEMPLQLSDKPLRSFRMHTP